MPAEGRDQGQGLAAADRAVRGASQRRPDAGVLALEPQLGFVDPATIGTAFEHPSCRDTETRKPQCEASNELGIRAGSKRASGSIISRPYRERTQGPKAPHLAAEVTAWSCSATALRWHLHAGTN